VVGLTLFSSVDGQRVAPLLDLRTMVFPLGRYLVHRAVHWSPSTPRAHVSKRHLYCIALQDTTEAKDCSTCVKLRVAEVLPAQLPANRHELPRTSTDVDARS